MKNSPKIKNAAEFKLKEIENQSRKSLHLDLSDGYKTGFDSGFIHGARWALENVLEHFEKNLGDDWRVKSLIVDAKQVFE